MTRKYDLPEYLDLLYCTPRKIEWKRRDDKQIKDYWVKFAGVVHVFTAWSLQYLAVNNYTCGRSHHLLRSCRSAIETNHVQTTLILTTATFILQTNRDSFKQVMVNPRCLLCKNAEETTQHFLFECPALASVHETISNIHCFKLVVACVILPLTLLPC